MKKWTVYQVENLINGRLYIGVHKTEDPDDGYLGSGKLIRYAIKKYGMENFQKTILLVTEDKAEAFALEKRLVTLERIESGALYNLKEGGEGGWDWCNRNSDIRSGIGRKRAIKSAQMRNHLARTDPIWREKLRQILSRSVKRRTRKPPNWIGRSHSESSKRKMSESKKITSAGERNSQFGTIWITDGIQCRKISAMTSIPIGWKRGRK